MMPVIGNNVQLDFTSAHLRLKKVVNRTPLTFNHNLSKKYECNVFLKREDLQVVRSYKLRGAYNMMSSLPASQLQKGVVFMPIITPKQKISQTKMFG
jgi:threonine dehydratase